MSIRAIEDLLLKTSAASVSNENGSSRWSLLKERIYRELQVRELTSFDLVVLVMVLAVSLVMFVWREPWLAVGVAASFAAPPFLLSSLRRFRALTLYLFSYFFVFALLRMNSFLSWPLDFFVVAAWLWVLRHVLEKKPLWPENFSFYVQSMFKWPTNGRLLVDYIRASLARLSVQAWLSVLLVTGVSVVILLGYFFGHQDVALRFKVPFESVGAVGVAILCAAVLNGLREELLFRFLFLDLLSGKMSRFGAVLLSSLLFGFVHYQNGFPAGGLGVVLTFCFGLAMCTQYFLFKSKKLVWLTHSLTDFLMFAVILQMK